MRILNGIVCFNDHQRVNHLIRYLRENSWGDILVVDNSVSKQKLFSAEVIQSKINSGSAGGFKQLMHEAKLRNYDFIVLHDSDGFPKNRPNFEVLSTQRVYNAFVRSECGRPNKVSNRSMIAGPVMVYDPKGFFKVIGPSSGKIIPIKVIEKVGLYDDKNFFVNLEDYDFDLRCHREGVSVVRLNDYIYVHPNHTNHNALSERFGVSIFNINLPGIDASERDKRMIHSSAYICRQYFSLISRLVILIVSISRASLTGRMALIRSHYLTFKGIFK